LALPFHWVSGIKEAYKGLLNDDILEGVKRHVSVSIYLQPANEISAIADDSVEKEVFEVSEIEEQDAALEPGSQPKYLSPKTRPGCCA